MLFIMSLFFIFLSLFKRRGDGEGTNNVKKALQSTQFNMNRNIKYYYHCYYYYIGLDVIGYFTFIPLLFAVREKQYSM